jgi:hypothetical protein
MIKSLLGDKEIFVLKLNKQDRANKQKIIILIYLTKPT